MNQKEQLDFFEKFTELMKETIIKKSGDYANHDKLSNFKLAGAVCGISPELNCLSLIATKVARLGVLINSNDIPNNEPLKDSVLDLANYSLLLAMLIEEK